LLQVKFVKHTLLASRTDSGHCATDAESVQTA